MDESPIKIAEASPGEEVRGQALFEALQRPVHALDRLVERFIPASLNPFAQSGAIANVCFLAAIVSGVLLLFWYTPSVINAWTSLEDISWSGQFVRSLHRYSSDATVFFVIVHATRMALGRRFVGARWIAWVTGFGLVALLWFVGWLGYWLVWDVRAQALVLETAKLIDPLPIFTDPLSRSFLTDGSVSTTLFFTVFFFHMLVPLAMAVALWMHISRVARAKFLTSRTMTAWLIGALLVASALFPARSAEPAAMADKLPPFTMDWWYLLPMALMERLGAGALWAIITFGAIAFLSVPWAMRRKKAEIAVVDLKRCNGCSLCAEDCPYGAIVMVPRSDGHGRYELEARVDADRCVGCGICAGSCNPGGIGLPSMPVQDKRRIVDEWIDGVQAEGEEVFIAFLCANSAAGDFTVNDDGECSELPGFKCVGVPCSGWVHALSVERALRRGAEGVLIVGCGCSDPPFREGVVHTEDRLKSRRDPGLRLEMVDPTKVRFIKHARGDNAGLTRDVDAFRAHIGAPPAAKQGRGFFGGAVLAGLIGAIVLVGSDLPSTLPLDTTPELAVSMAFRPEGEQCRPATEAEKAKMLVHMRRDTICERQRSDARLEIVVDEVVVHSEAYEAKGVSSDGPSFALVRLPVTAGPHDVVVRIGDAGREGWTHTFQRTIEFGDSHRQVVSFDTNGWRLGDREILPAD